MLRGMQSAPSQIDIVVPVFNEAAVLEQSVRRLHRFLLAQFPFSWRIVVADNASTDATPAIAARLARELAGVELLRLERKGRGRALRSAWSASPARRPPSRRSAVPVSIHCCWPCWRSPPACACGS
jgi:cellulose synthase/poly-beta-1,6-N-acetylglucosamine synthase-like glycosyltransferase